MNVETTRALYTPVIRQEIEDHFPKLLTFYHGELIIHAQIYQESGWNPAAESHCGAKGLMQLMPATDKWIDGDYDGFDPEGNLDNGIRYMGWLYGRFGEIPDPYERICFALASYNGGRGYINKALELGRRNDGHPGDFGDWIQAGRPDGRWQRWPFAQTFLGDPRCIVDGKRPDYKQIREYVTKIMRRYRQLIETE